MSQFLKSFCVRFSFFAAVISPVLLGVSASPANAAFPVKVSGGAAAVNAVAVLPSGTMIIGGDFTQLYNGVPPANSTATPRSYLALLDSTGQPLSGFSGLDAAVKSLVLLKSSGSVVSVFAAGDFTGRVARFTPAGVKDSTFNPDTVTSGLIASIAVQSDGKVVVAGDDGAGKAYLARLNADGTPDAAFNANVSFVGTIVSSVAVQSDGQILIGGQFTQVDGAAQQYLARLNADGTLDTSFSPVVNAAVSGVAIDSSSRIIIVGDFTAVAGTARAKVARLGSGGALDTSFAPGSGPNTEFRPAVVAEQGGKIYVGGQSLSSFSGETRYSIVRLNADGSVDLGFVPPEVSAPSFVQGFDFQTDGKPVLVGYFPGSRDSYEVIRLGTNGSSDSATSSQTVTLNPLPSTSTYGDPSVQITGAASTGVGTTSIVTFSSSNPAVASIIHNPSSDPFSDTWYVVYAGAGSATITAYQSGTIDATRAGSASQTITVNKAVLSVIADSKTRVTGAANPTLTYAFNESNFVGTDTAAVVSGTPVLSTSATPSSPAGNYPISIDVSGLSAANYSFSPVSGVLTVLPQSASASFAATAFTGTEDAGKADITLVRTGSSDAVLVAKVLPGGGSAAAPADYTFAPGAVDSTFLPPSLGDNVYAVALQSDGKPLLGGKFTGRVKRLKLDGTVDTFTPPTIPSGNVMAIAQQANGKIVIGGTFTSVGGEPRSCIARLNADGSLDSTGFTASGAASSFPFVLSVAVQPIDQKIVVGGSFTTFNGSSRSNVVRLNSDGTLDSTFTASATNPSTGVANVYATAVQSDGKILIGGDFTTVNGTAVSRIARLNADGSLDSTFAVGTGIAGNLVQTITIATDGKVLLGGDFTGYNGTSAKNIIRLNADGTVDSSFTPPAAATGKVRSIYIQPDGKVLLGGEFAGGPIRVTSTGASDPSFAPGTGNPTGSMIYAIAMQGDGKIVVGGTFTSYNATSSIKYITRLSGDLFVTWGVNDTASKVVSIPIPTRAGTQGLRTLNLGLAAFPTSYATVTTPSSAVVSIYDLSQTITFGTLSPLTYGAAPFSPATASSALAITYTSSNTAVATGGSSVTIKGAGQATITAYQDGSGGYAPAAPVAQLLTVGKKALTVTGPTLIRSYGVANPTFTPAYSGFAYAETPSVLSGSPSLTTSATSGSQPGDYAITVAAGSLASANYSFSFVNGMLTIAPLPSVTITPGFTSPTASASASFTIGGTGVVTYRYQLDGTGYSAETAVSAPVTLASIGEGSHTLSVIGKNSAGDWQATPATFTWSVDRTPPTVTLSALPDQAVTGDDTVNVAGIATDANGVGNVTINGNAVTLNADGSFSYPVPLTLNQSNVLTTVATDSIGNQVTDVRTIVNGAAPQLALTSPSDNISTVESFVTVSGTVSDAGATITALREGDGAGTTASGPSFAIPVNVQPGINTIIITAAYPGGGTATAKRTVFRATSGPSVAITGPSQDITSTNPGIIVQGAVADANSPSVTVTVDAQTFSPQISGGAFSQSIAFSAEKTYDIVVAVTDGSATTTVQRNVIHHLPTFAGPTIKIGSASGLRTKTVSVPVTLKNIAGTSLVSAAVEIGYDAGALQSPTVVAGSAATAAGKSVTATSPAPGVYHVSVSGPNANVIGDGTIATVTFTVASSAPYAATSLVDIPSATDGGGNGVSALGVNGIVHVITKPGDASGDGNVSIGEVQSAINMFLGTKSPTFYADLNGDGSVSIGEVQKAINAFLGL